MRSSTLAAVFALTSWLSPGAAFSQQNSSAPTITTPSAASQDPQNQPSVPPATATPQLTKPSGKVLFSRSEDDNKASETPGNAAKQEQTGPSGTENLQGSRDEQESVTFLAYDLDVHLTPRQQAIAVRARMTLRNDGTKPLDRLSFQLSSTLKWERLRVGGKEAAFTQHPVESDGDHTGAVTEALVSLASPLASGQETQVEGFYSGLIPLGSGRLERLGAPNQVAERSDWDQISADFVGLRGFGNVVWYPVSAPPVMLGDGAKLFGEIGRQSKRQKQAHLKMMVTSEYRADDPAPNLAVLSGRVVPVVQASAPANSFPGVVTATLPETTLGFATPSLFLLKANKVQGSGIDIYAAAEDLKSAPAYFSAVSLVTPVVQRWLGTNARSPLSVVGLPDPGDVAAEEGSAFFTGFQAAPDPKALQNSMVHSLAHVYFQSPRVWLNEGVPQFLGSLWIEQVKGRQAALEALESARSGLAIAEPGAPGESPGEDLLNASSIVYYRTKATNVLWMLRDLAGDDALATALKSYVPEQDTAPDYFQRLLEKSSGKDLQWFFDGWVYHDRGLPELSIGGVFPSKASVEGQWLVAFEIANDGFVETEVPVTVRSKDATVTERLRIGARSKISRRVLIGGKPIEIQANDGTVPEVAETIHSTKLVDAAP